MRVKDIKTKYNVYQIILYKGMYAMPRMTRLKAIELYGDYKVLSLTEFKQQGLISVVVRK